VKLYLGPMIYPRELHRMPEQCRLGNQDKAQRSHAKVLLERQQTGRDLRLKRFDTYDQVCLWTAIQTRKGLMSVQPKAESAAKIPPEINAKLRTLAHDLSNSVETIMQASYLLAQSNLDDTSKKWAELIDKASRDCAKINREIRDILKASI